MATVMGEDSRGSRALAPLLVMGVVVVFVALGLARGVWLSNLHNALLASAFTAVGAYLYLQRPAHREAILFLATGALEALVFLGRQYGHTPEAAGSRWWAWLGVWPVAIALALTTLSVLCFPDGCLPSPRWRPVAATVALIAVLCAVMSAVWPVEYESVGVSLAHPIHGDTPRFVELVWSATAHPAYAAFQVLWAVAIISRWRQSHDHTRVQLFAVAVAAATSAIALVIGLLVWRTPRAGVLTAAVVPLTAGWAIVHGQRLARYSALSWLSRRAPGSSDLPTDLAKALALALFAPRATLWIGDDHLHAVGIWPETTEQFAPATLAQLHDTSTLHVRAVTKGGQLVGALSIDRDRKDRASLAESQLFDKLGIAANTTTNRRVLAALAYHHQI